jgi:hypothetical protein
MFKPGDRIYVRRLCDGDGRVSRRDLSDSSPTATGTRIYDIVRENEITRVLISKGDKPAKEVSR